MQLHVMTWNTNGLQTSRTRVSRRMLMRKDLQRNVVGDIDVLMIWEHKIAQPFGNLMRAGFRTFWEPVMGPSSRSGGVCIFVGERLLSSVRHHSTLIAGRALYVAIDIEDTLVGFLSIYAPNTPRKKANFWSQLIETLPIVSTWIIGGDFNNIESETLPIVSTWIIGGDFNNIESNSDWCSETRPILSLISPHEQDEWDRFLLATDTTDAWHVLSFGRSQGSLSFSWGFRGQVFPAGRVHLHMPRFADHYTWSKITTCIHNVVVGKLWIDNYGEIVIRNHTTGDISRIRFHKATSKEQGRLTGKVFDKNGILMCSLLGNYMNQISIIPETSWTRRSAYGDTKCLWKCPALPEDYEQQYCFSRFTIGLNELTPELRDSLPPTDSRFRPDQRGLEDGDLEKATPEKIRLEEKQREASRRRRENGDEWTCMWFQQRVPGVSQVNTAGEADEEPTWVFNGEYWRAREKQDWRKCPDIM
ncbi:hypothetical protein L7F22_017573 [Adiantum nelumboides]|nr:hypothetical protein [Adiantum nelumboides]